MAEELEVIIGANTSGVTRAEAALDRMAKSLANIERHLTKNDNVVKKTEKSFNALEYAAKNNRRELDRIGVTTKKTTAVIDKMGDEAAQTATQINQVGNRSWTGMDNLSRRTNTTAKAIGNLGKTTNVNAVPAMQEFSRVIQDAPYGIMGVGNNIQQLTANFGYLSKQAGGTIPALKLMVKSLAGPAGILLAVSAVTTLLTVFSDEIFNSGEASKTAAEKLDDYIDSLRGVEKATLDASVSASKELVQLKLLSAQATNTALSTSERTAAVNELRSLYPSYLKGMSDEEILANGLSTAYAEVTKNIMRKASAQAASNLMVENMEQELKLSNRLARVESDIEEQREKNAKLLQKAQDVGGQNLYFREAAKGEERVNKLLEERVGLQGQIQSRQLENIDLAQSVKASGDLIVTPEDVTVDESGGVTPNISPIRVPITPIMGDLSGDGGDPRLQASLQWQAALTRELELLKEQQSFLPQFSEGWKMYGEAIAGVEDRLSGFANSLAESGQMASEEFAKMAEDPNIDEFKNKLAETDEYTNMFASSAGTAISELGNVFQQQFAESGKAMQIFSGLVINTLTQIISKLTQAAIKNIGIKQAESTAGGIKAATETASATGPAAAFVLPGLIAGMVGLVASQFSSIKGFNFGGFVGDNNIVRMNGNERVLTATEANTFNNLMQNRNVDTRSFSDNTMKVEVVGRIDGETIRLVGERNERNRSRIG